jgi:hypothetical protein
MKLPRFSLRTLLIAIALLSIPMGWVACQLNWIRQRREFMLLHGSSVRDPQKPNSKLPWSLRAFGEQGYDYLLRIPADFVSEATALFPESEINPKPPSIWADE